MRVLACLFACLALAAGQNCPTRGVKYYRDNSQCDKYYECRDGVYSERLCPDGLLFNDQITKGHNHCQYAPEVNCHGRNIQQPAQPTEFCPRQWGYYGSGNRADCGYYYNCIDGQGSKVNCPAGLAFSSATYICEWPGESVDCDAEAFLGFTCPPAASQKRFRSPSDCRQYFVCFGGSPRLLSCELGEVFNEATYICDDHPEQVNGCKNYYPTEDLVLYRKLRELKKSQAHTG